MPVPDENLKIYWQEETDTGIVFHVLAACRNYPYSELTISCSDTDVLLILFKYFEQLPSTLHLTIYILKRFTPRVCKVLLGSHTMTGSDQTGRFHGRTKQSCWNDFLKSTNDMLDAFIHLRVSDSKQDTHFPFLKSFVVALYF